MFKYYYIVNIEVNIVFRMLYNLIFIITYKFIIICNQICYGILYYAKVSQVRRVSYNRFTYNFYFLHFVCTLTLQEYLKIID